MRTVWEWKPWDRLPSGEDHERRKDRMEQISNALDTVQIRGRLRLLDVRLVVQLASQGFYWLHF